MTDQQQDSPLRNREATRLRLIEAVGELLAEKGFTRLGINAVAKQAGVDKVYDLPLLRGAARSDQSLWSGG